jgi:Site-specific recombinase XerD
MMKEEESIHMLQASLSGHRLEAIITLAIVTGMRRDELLRLTWSDIDLEKGEMRVLNSKTNGGLRQIHLTEAYAQVLKQHSLYQMEQRSKAGIAGTAWPDFDLVFPDDEGKQLSSQCFLEEWYTLLKQMGLPRQRFHDLRVLVWQGMLK